MKDKNLENAFEEYFGGVTAPQGLIADAKKQLNEQTTLQKRRRKFAARFTAVAAGVAAVCVTAGLVGYGLFGSLSPAPAAQIEYYGFSSLTPESADGYCASSINPSLKFIERLAHGRNSSVTDCTVYTDENGEIALLKANVIYVNGLYKHDTVLYAEFTRQNLVCDLFRDFENYGSYSYADGINYKIYNSEDGGENVGNIAVETGEIKYYISVKGSDDYAFRKYIDLIIKN